MMTDVAGNTSRVSWLPWNSETFARAKVEQRPVLLTVGATWCRWSAEMLCSTYQNSSVRQLIECRYIPIWVDADQRPDISERYTLGGWPTTVFLSPTGWVLGGETYVGAERMAMLLTQVADAFDLRSQEFMKLLRKPVTSSASSVHFKFSHAEDLEQWLTSYIVEQFDVLHAGFGSESKRVQASAMRFALLKFQEGDTTFGDVAIRTLDALGWGGLYDDVEGGVFRCCAERNWTTPNVEKLLSINAETLQLLLDGWLALSEPRYRDRAADLLRYVWNNLVDLEPGGFFSSQAADKNYYAADINERQHLVQPPIDQAIYTDSTAKMAKAFIHAAAVFNDSSLLEFAVKSLERVVMENYQRGNGVGHYLDEALSVRGLLVDQVAASDALLDLYSATDRDAYLDMAQELMLFAGRALWDSKQGVFFDRVITSDDIGLLREPIKPFDTNCDAARVLIRLSKLTGRTDFIKQAESALAFQLPTVSAQGVNAARWALAARELKIFKEETRQTD